MKFIRFRKINGGWQLTCEYCDGRIQSGTHYIRGGEKNRRYWHEQCAPKLCYRTIVDNYDRLQLKEVV